MSTMEPGYFSIEHLIKTELPPLPASVARVSPMLVDMNISENEIAEAISHDPILSTRVLRLANSPIYSMQGTITNLKNAVSTVGNDAIGHILMMSGISDSFGRRILGSPAGKEIWQHLLATALTASELCKLTKMRGGEEAFSCGLLHDIGKLILLRADSPFYVQLIARGPAEGGLPAVEQKVLGFDHAELGAAAAASWNLPEPVCELIRNHHHPEKASMGIAMSHLINLADAFVSAKIATTDYSELMQSETAKTFGLKKKQFEKVWDKVSATLNEMQEEFA